MADVRYDQQWQWHHTEMNGGNCTSVIYHMYEWNRKNYNTDAAQRVTYGRYFGLYSVHGNSEYEWQEMKHLTYAIQIQSTVYFS